MGESSLIVRLKKWTQTRQISQISCSMAAFLPIFLAEEPCWPSSGGKRGALWELVEGLWRDLLPRLCWFCRAPLVVRCWDETGAKLFWDSSPPPGKKFKTDKEHTNKKQTNKRVHLLLKVSWHLVYTLFTLSVSAQWTTGFGFHYGAMNIWNSQQLMLIVQVKRTKKVIQFFIFLILKNNKTKKLKVNISLQKATISTLVFYTCFWPNYH